MSDELTPPAGEKKKRRREQAQKVAYGVCFAAAVILTVALAFRHPSLFNSVPPHTDQVKEYPKRWVFIAAPVLLLALSIFRVVRGKRARGSSITVSALSLSFSLFATLLFCVLFGVLLSTPEELEQTLVYILGFAALIIGGQHLVEFEEAQQAVSAVNEQLGRTSETLSNRLGEFEQKVNTLTGGINTSITRLTQTLGYEGYREIVTKAYAEAHGRVLGSTNHWPIDLRFWSPGLAGMKDLDDPDDEFWESQDVFLNLRNAIRNTRKTTGPLRIDFVGRLSVVPGESMPALSPENFTLFLGVLWRLALAHRLREEMRQEDASDEYLAGSRVRVMVADVPINCHVVGDEAFLLLHMPSEDGGHSYGLRIPPGSGAAVHDGTGHPSIADTYVEIVERYTRTHVRSAREYAASLLALAAIATAEKPFQDTVLMRDEEPETEHIKELLRTLGMQAWVDRECGPNRDIHTESQLSRDALEAGATLLACDFVKHYYKREKIYELPNRRGDDGKWYPGTVTVDLLIEDLI